MKKKDKTKYLWYFIAIGALILFVLIMLSSIISLGEKLRNISIYLEIAFYVLVALIVIFLIIRPIFIIVKSPSLKLVTSTNKDTKESYRIYKSVAKNIIKNNELTHEEVMSLTRYKAKEELLINLNLIFEKSIKNKLNDVIIKNSKTVLISTAICQSSKFDLATTFIVNLNMIKEMVQLCGFRPTMKNLSKLTVNVFSTALIADGIENIKLEDVLPNSVINSIGEVPMLGKVIESVVGGAINALLTIRIGCVTRRYLYSDGDIVTKESIRRDAYKEALLLIPTVLEKTITFFPKKVIKFFSKYKKEEV